MEEELKNPYPEEFGYYRIGTPINADLCKAMPESPAFEMGRLQAARCLDWSANPTSTKTLQAGGSDHRSQNASGYAVDVAASVKTPWVDVTMSSHASQSWNHTERHNAQTITAVARQETSIRLRANVSDSVMLSCATADFTARMAAISTAAEELAAAEGTDGGQDALNALDKALVDFYTRYGTGFVSKLRLGSLGVFQAIAHYDSDSDDEHANFGGNVSVSGYFGGLSAAAEYAKHHMTANASGTIVCKTFCMPPSSKAATWVEGLMTAFDGQQLANLGKLEAWQKPFQAPVDHPQPPTIKERKPQEALAEFKGATVEAKLQNMELLRLSSEYKKTKGTDPTPDEYRAWLADLRQIARNVDEAGHAAKAKPAVAGLSHGKLASLRASMLQFIASPPPAFGSPSPASGADSHAPSQLGALLKPGDGDGYPRPAIPPPRSSASGLQSSDDVNFGDYAVIGYEYTPWERAFPALRPFFSPAMSFSKLTLAYAMTWLSSRQMLQQYLAFCGRWFSGIAPLGCAAAANAYRDALAVISTELAGSGASSPDAIPERLEAQFREALRHTRFPLMRHYEFLLEHLDWLRRVPFGAVPLVPNDQRDPHWYYFPKAAIELKGELPQHECARIEAADVSALALLESNALRLYPVLCTDLDGQPNLFWANRQEAFVTAPDGRRTLSPKYRPGAAITKTVALPAVENLRAWGMCNTADGAPIEEIFRRERAAKSRRYLAVPAPDTALDAAVWPLTPDVPPATQPPSQWWQNDNNAFAAHYFYFQGRKDYTGDYNSMSDSGTDKQLRLMIGEDAHADYSAMRLAGVTPGPFIVLGGQCAREGHGEDMKVDLSMAPVDYTDARMVGAVTSGGPMWAEPASGRILDLVRTWAQQCESEPTQE